MASDVSKIVVLVTAKNGQVKQLDVPAGPNRPPHTRIKAEPQAQLTVLLQGEVLNGKALASGQTPRLKKRGQDLIVELDGELLLEIVDFYAVEGASLAGPHWQAEADLGLVASEAGTLSAPGKSAVPTDEPVAVDSPSKLSRSSRPRLSHLVNEFFS